MCSKNIWPILKRLPVAECIFGHCCKLEGLFIKYVNAITINTNKHQQPRQKIIFLSGFLSEKEVIQKVRTSSCEYQGVKNAKYLGKFYVHTLSMTPNIVFVYAYQSKYFINFQREKLA